MDGWGDAASPIESDGGAWGNAASPIDTAEQAPEPQMQSLPGENAFRQVGLTGRYLAGGIPLAVAGLGDLANSGINAVTGSNLGMPSDQVNKALTGMGFPEPQGDEKPIGALANGVVGFMGGGENSANALRDAGTNAQEMLANYFAKDDLPKTSQAAKAIASRYYKQAAETGGQLTPQFTNSFIDTAKQLAPQTEEGALFAGETPITSLTNKAELLRDRPLSLPAAQEIDEHLGSLIDGQYGLKGLSKDGRQLLDLQSNFRNMIADAQAGDTVGGTEGFEALKSGRNAWAQAAKMQDIEKIATRAALSDNPATTIKSNVRTILSNPARVRGYSPDELAALQAAGNRGILGSTLHVFGSRLVPYATAMMGEAHGGPAMAAVGGALGHAGSSALRNGATALQNARLQNVLSVMGRNVE